MTIIHIWLYITIIITTVLGYPLITYIIVGYNHIVMGTFWPIPAHWRLFSLYLDCWQPRRSTCWVAQFFGVRVFDILQPWRSRCEVKMWAVSTSMSTGKSANGWHVPVWSLSSTQPWVGSWCDKLRSQILRNCGQQRIGLHAVVGLLMPLCMR